MAVPSDIFIDTNIFDSQHFDFESREFKKFKEVLRGKTRRLLLPHPVQLEVERHVKEQAHSAASSLKGAQKKSPMLRRLAEWPLNRAKHYEIGQEIEASEMRSLNEFFDSHTTVKLDYGGVSIATVMKWYDEGSPPFGEGLKRKEFPDAFTIAILDEFVKSTPSSIAVISNDEDFVSACKSRRKFIHFPSLSAYIQASLFEEEQLLAIREMLSKDKKLSVAVEDAFPMLGFVIEEDWDGEVSDVKVTNVNFTEQDVVEMDDEGVTISFEAEVTYSATLQYEDPNSGYHDSEDDVWMFRDEVNTEVEELAVVTGSASFSLNSEKTEIETVSELIIDDSTITIVAQPMFEYD